MNWPEMNDTVRRGLEARRRRQDGEPEGEKDVMKNIKKSMTGDVVREYALEDQPGGDLYRPGRQVEGPSTGADGLDRNYSDSILERLGGGDISGTRTAPIPTAGAGPAWVGEPGDVDSDFDPMAGGEGDAGRVGGEDRGARSFAPNLGSDKGGGYVNVDDATNGFDGLMTRAGDMHLLSPSWSGISEPGTFRPLAASAAKAKQKDQDVEEAFYDEDEADAKSAKAMYDEDDAKAKAKKSVRKSAMGRGLFSNLLDPMPGTNFFSGGR